MDLNIKNATKANGVWLVGHSVDIPHQGSIASVTTCLASSLRESSCTEMFAPSAFGFPPMKALIA